jgi:hypothetical protein
MSRGRLKRDNPAAITLRWSIRKLYECEPASSECPPSHYLGLVVEIDRCVEVSKLTEVLQADPDLEPVRQANVAAT